MDINAYPLIGMTGFARVGKDTSAATLIEEFGFVRYAVADKMRALVKRMNPYVDGCIRYAEVPTDMESRRLRAALAHAFQARDCGIGAQDVDVIHRILLSTNPFINGVIRLDPLVMRLGWEGIKNDARYRAESRGLVQRFGTDAVRDTIGDSVWVDELAHAIALGGRHGVRPVVVTDVRLDSEASWIRSNGGLVWKVVRPGFGPVNGHRTELGVDPALIDATIVNDGAVEDLSSRVSDLVISSFR